MKLDWELRLKQTGAGASGQEPTGAAIQSWLSQTFGISHRHHSTIKAMEGLRGFAAFLVFLVHYDGLVAPLVEHGSLEYQVNRILWNIGTAGVDLFFVLSGYVIYRLLIKKSWQFRDYLLRRLQRIYPTFLVVFGLYLMLSVVFSAESKIPHSSVNGGIYILENLLLLPGMLDIRPMIAVAWSLSYEFFFYLAAPFLIVIFCLPAWRRGWRVTLFASLSVAGFCYSGLLHGGHVRLLMFIAGMLLYEATDSRAVDLPRWVGLSALLVALIAMPLLKWGAWRYVVLYVCFFFLCLDSFSTAGITSRIFSWLPLRWYGNMSYSYYLVHGLALKAVFKFVTMLDAFSAWPGISWLLLLPIFLLTLVPAVLLFIFIEKPFSLNQPFTANGAAKARKPQT